MEDFKMFVRAKIKECPELKNDILDYYQLALDEIEQGGSESNEISIATSAILYDIKEYQETH